MMINEIKVAQSKTVARRAAWLNVDELFLCLKSRARFGGAVPHVVAFYLCQQKKGGAAAGV